MKVEELIKVIDGFSDIRIFESIEQDIPIFEMGLYENEFQNEIQKYMDKEIRWMLASDVQCIDVVIELSSILD